MNAIRRRLFAARAQLGLAAEEGQTFVEYTLVLVLVALVVGIPVYWGVLTTAITTAVGSVAAAI